MRFALLALALIAVPGVAHAADPITGTWRTADGKAIVRIAPCGTVICGRTIKILATNAPRLDVRNADPGLRRRPLLGLQVLTGFTDSGGDWRGRVYSPEEGKTYRSVVSRNANGTLKVKGCIAIFCKTQTWTPVR